MDTEGVNTKITVDNEQAIEGYQEAGDAATTYSEDVQTASGEVSASNDTMVESNGGVVQSHQALTTASGESTTSLKEGVMGASEAAAGAVGLMFSVDELNQAQLTVDKAHKAVLTTTIALQKAQSDYTDAVNKYGADSPQAQTALEKLTAAQEGAKDAAEKLDIAQSNQSQTEMMMAVSIMPELISMITGISSAWGVLGPILGIGAEAEDVSAESTDVLSDSFLGLDVSMGVILIAIAAIAIAAYLIYTNWGTVQSFFEGLWNGVVGFFTWAGGVIEPIVNAIGSVVGGVMNGINTVFHFVFDAISTYVQIEMAIIKAFIIDPINAVYSILSGVFSDITGVFQSAFNIIQQVVTDAMNVINPIIQPFVDAMDAVGGVVNSISSAGNDIVSGVTSFFGFAEGGHVDATPGGKVVRVAEAGEGEWMIPDSKMNAIVGSKGNISMPTSVNSSSSTSSSSSVSIGTIIIQGGSGQEMGQQFTDYLKQQNIKVSTG